MRDQVEQTRVLNVVFCSATALGSRLPSMANARAKVAGAGAMLRPVSSSTQVNSFSFWFTYGRFNDKPRGGKMGGSVSMVHVITSLSQSGNILVQVQMD